MKLKYDEADMHAQLVKVLYPDETAMFPVYCVYTVSYTHLDVYKRQLSDRVVIKMLEAEETTKGGIILTSAAQEKPQVAEVVAVGPGKTVDGKLVPVQLKVGDKVLMSKYSGTEVKVDGEEYTILREEDILAVVE